MNQPNVRAQKNDDRLNLDAGEWIDVDVVSAKRNHRRESAGLLSSIALHAALGLLFALFLAPIDLGGSRLRLQVLFSSQEKIEDLALMDLSLVQSEPEPQDAASTIDPMTVALPSGKDSSSQTGSRNGVRQGGDASGTKNGPRGSFFGINAYGHEFVYVLDVSGSMKGRRFDHAVDELEKSVNSLDESQSFYVLLYDDSTIQMFNDSSIGPQAIPATWNNKQRLTQWVRSAYSGGGTDPRDALRIAMQMNPSAVFMLSDGEFNGHQNQKRKDLFGGKSDAFSIVAASLSDAPIHAIALEDRASCANMMRLAEMTGGDYRFVQFENDDKEILAASDMLLKAQTLLAAGQSVKSIETLEEALRMFGHTSVAVKCQHEINAIVASVLDPITKRRARGDHVNAAKMLRRSINKFSGTQVAKESTSELEEIALEMLAKARDANFQRDRAASKRIELELEAAFASHETLRRMRVELSKRERNSRDLFRRGQRMERIGDEEAAFQSYLRAAQYFPDTLAARKAKVEIARIRPATHVDQLTVEFAPQNLDPDGGDEFCLTDPDDGGASQPPGK